MHVFMAKMNITMRTKSGLEDTCVRRKANHEDIIDALLQVQKERRSNIDITPDHIKAVLNPHERICGRHRHGSNCSDLDDDLPNEESKNYEESSRRN
ncbi:hypothetical protein Q3G72_001377 [Acer saccharum]|nr:hypothetical protein Q3G72_001377 [Acer saccharum]